MADEVGPVPGSRLFGQLLHDVDRLMQRRLDQYTRRLGMTRAQWWALEALEAAPGCNQRELATTLNCDPITLTRLLDRLCAADLVERYPDRTDRRVWRLRLTQDGARAVSRMRQCAMDYEIESVAGLTPADLAALHRLLQVAKANLIESMGRSCPSGTDHQSGAPVKEPAP